MDRPIIFSGPMVRALLEGRKTQTRRLLNLRQYRGMTEFGPSDTAGYDWHFRRADKCWCDITETRLGQLLPIAVGDRLYVREDWGSLTKFDSMPAAPLREALIAGNHDDAIRKGDGIYGRRRAGRFMPRWASRLTLTVTDVRVQRVRDISEADAAAEGCVWDSADGYDIWYVPGAQLPRNGATARECFSILWNSLHAKSGTRWEDNPWIYALTLTVEHGNIDAISQHEGERS